MATITHGADGELEPMYQVRSAVATVKDDAKFQ